MAQPFVEPCSSGIITAEPCPRALGREMSPGRRRAVLAACVCASSMAFIDGSALTVALPRMRDDFATDLAFVQWVLNGYVLALASMTMIGGTLADLYGKARMLAIGCLLFGVASIACALSPFCRVADWCPDRAGDCCSDPHAGKPRAHRRNLSPRRAQPGDRGVGGGIGPDNCRRSRGRWLADLDVAAVRHSQRPPFALVAIGILQAVAPEDQHEPRQFDLIGAALLAAALGGLAWALSQIGPGESSAATAASSASGTTIAIAAALSILGLVAYAWWECFSEHPMTPPRLTANRVLVGLNLATLMVYAGLSIMFFLLPFDLVDRRGLSATDAGLAFLPFTLGVGLLSRFFGGVADAIGARFMLIAGPVGAALAYGWMAAGQQSALLSCVIAPMALLGISFAVLVAPLTASIMSSVSESDEGLASGINNAATRVAELAGVALASGVAAFGSGYQIGLHYRRGCLDRRRACRCGDDSTEDREIQWHLTADRLVPRPPDVTALACAAEPAVR